MFQRHARVWIVWIALAALPACGGGPAARPEPAFTTHWIQMQDRRFRHARTDEILAPRELLDHGKALAAAGKTDTALDAFRALHLGSVDMALKAEALLEEARTLAAADRRIEAHGLFVEMLDRYPDAPAAATAMPEAFENAFTLLERGDPHRLLGIRLFSSDEPGLQAARNLLARFPRETYSPDYAFRLGEHYFRRADYDMAIVEFDSVRKDYPRTPWAEAAMLRIGLCHLQQFKALPYDPHPLVEARQRFERFLLDYPNSALTGDATAKLAEVKALQAAKDLKIADYYRARRRRGPARAMYEAVVRDYPGTPAAAEAAHSLEGLPPPEPPAAEPAPEQS